MQTEKENLRTTDKKCPNSMRTGRRKPKVNSKNIF